MRKMFIPPAGADIYLVRITEGGKSFHSLSSGINPINKQKHKMKSKKYKKQPLSETKVNEPSSIDYGRMSISSFEESEEQMREYTRNMNHLQRMEYLNKLISITHGEDLSEYEHKFYSGRIKIN